MRPKKNGDAVEPLLHDASSDLPVRLWWDAQFDAKATPYVPSLSATEQVRKPGLRALMIYPLNALVDDQMRRLRHALDSQEMHALYAERFQGHTPRFARYTSATIGGTSNVADLGNHAKSLDANWNGTGFGAEIRRSIEFPFVEMFSARRGHPPEPGALMSAAEALEGRDPEDGFVVQNPWGCEQRFRRDIQTCAPDMLVTNLSLLSVLAARTTTEDQRILTRRLLTSKMMMLVSTWCSTNCTCTRICRQKRHFHWHHLGPTVPPDRNSTTSCASLPQAHRLMAGEGAFLQEFFGVPFEADAGTGNPVSTLNPALLQGFGREPPARKARTHRVACRPRAVH